MAGLQWSSTLDFGIAKIDDQHRHLIDIANRVIEAVQEKLGVLGVDEIVKELREYTVLHFQDEEVCMVAARYPGYNMHQNEHVRLTNQVKQWQRDIFKRENLSVDEVLTFMRGWVLDHVLNSDMAFRDWLTQNPTALPKSGKGQTTTCTPEPE